MSAEAIALSVIYKINNKLKFLHQKSRFLSPSKRQLFCNALTLLHFDYICSAWYSNLQKQPSRGVLKKRCSENMQKIYRKTPMPKCDLKEVSNRTSAWVFSYKFAECFWNSIF